MSSETTKQVYMHPDQYISLGKKLRKLRQRVNPKDIFSTAHHSRDFKNSRAEYISIRIRTLALVFAVLAPLWIPIDYLVMEYETFVKFLFLRLGFAISFFSLAMWGTRCNRLFMARVRVFLFIVIPGLFYLISHHFLPNSGSDHAILFGYSFLPLLIMALMTIVPLTVLEGVGFLSLIVAIFTFTQLLEQTLFTIVSLGELWLLILLGMIALWVEITQLHMLMRLYREATRDALTGLVNRRILSAKIEEELAPHNRKHNELCVLLFDLDLFKRINDSYGHNTGDTVLQAFADILGDHCQGNVTAGRYGGEEFLAIIPNCRIDKAKELAETIRLACHEVTVCSPDNQEVNFTTSIGIAHRKPSEDAQSLLSRVDDGLYKAKAAGRDFVAIAD